MNKLVVYTIVAVVLAGAVGGYRYLTRTEVVQIESPAAPQPQRETVEPKIRPNHGDFDKRFRPTP